MPSFSAKDISDIARKSIREGYTQEQLAAEYGVSRTTIGRALETARDTMIKTIFLDPDDNIASTAHVKHLENQVSAATGLKQVTLTDVKSVHPDDYGIVRQSVAKIAAEYLLVELKSLARKNDRVILAVSGGKTKTRQILPFLQPDRAFTNVDVIATMGWLRQYSSYGDANIIASDMGRILRSSNAWFPIPGIADTQKQREEFQRHNLVSSVLADINKADIFVFGMWAPYDQRLIKPDPKSHAKAILSVEQIKAIEAHNPCVNVDLWFFDEEGNSINRMLSSKNRLHLTGFEFPKLKDKIINDGTKAMLVTSTRDEAEITAMNALIKSGCVTHLVTDYDSGLRLLNRYEAS